MNNWLPRSVESLRNYDRHKFLSDLIAGITVGLVALPLAMAFAISSGLPPQNGIYCAFVVIVYGIVQEHGVEGRFCLPSSPISLSPCSSA